VRTDEHGAATLEQRCCAVKAPFGAAADHPACRDPDPTRRSGGRVQEEGGEEADLRLGDEQLENQDAGDQDPERLAMVEVISLKLK
jgi:hypothetical protein